VYCTVLYSTPLAPPGSRVTRLPCSLQPAHLALSSPLPSLSPAPPPPPPPPPPPRPGPHSLPRHSHSFHRPLRLPRCPSCIACALPCPALPLSTPPSHLAAHFGRTDRTKLIDNLSPFTPHGTVEHACLPAWPSNFSRQGSFDWYSKVVVGDESRRSTQSRYQE
jgi:hypothetical protein